MAEARYRPLRGAVGSVGGLRSKQATNTTEGTEEMTIYMNEGRKRTEIARLDALERAMNLNEGVKYLLVHLAASKNEIEAVEVEALAELTSLTASTLSALNDDMRADRTATQSAEYWRGYDDGKAAATTSARQKAATLPVGE